MICTQCGKELCNRPDGTSYCKICVPRYYLALTAYSETNDFITALAIYQVIYNRCVKKTEKDGISPDLWLDRVGDIVCAPHQFQGVFDRKYMHGADVIYHAETEADIKDTVLRTFLMMLDVFIAGFRHPHLTRATHFHALRELQNGTLQYMKMPSKWAGELVECLKTDDAVFYEPLSHKMDFLT